MVEQSPTQNNKEMKESIRTNETDVREALMAVQRLAMLSWSEMYVDTDKQYFTAGRYGECDWMFHCNVSMGDHYIKLGRLADLVRWYPDDKQTEIHEKMNKALADVFRMQRDVFGRMSVRVSIVRPKEYIVVTVKKSDGDAMEFWPYGNDKDKDWLRRMTEFVYGKEDAA